MATNHEGRRIAIAGPLLVVAIALVLVAASLRFAAVRRSERINALRSYAKGEADCRLLGSKYLAMESQEQAEAAKSEDGSEKQKTHLSNAAYYQRMAEDSYRIAASNAEMIRKLKQSLGKT